MPKGCERGMFLRRVSYGIGSPLGMMNKPVLWEYPQVSQAAPTCRGQFPRHLRFLRPTKMADLACHVEAVRGRARASATTTAGRPVDRGLCLQGKTLQSG